MFRLALPTTTMRRVLNTIKTASTCGMYVCVILISLSLSLSLSLQNTLNFLSSLSLNNNNRYDTSDIKFNSSKLTSVVRVVEASNLIFSWILHLKHQQVDTPCSDVFSVFRSYGYEDLCFDSYDTTQLHCVGNVCLFVVVDN